MEISFAELWDNLSRLGAAYLIALPVAWNRERGNDRNAGLRTFPLVAIACCGYMIVGMQVITSTEGEARVLHGLITGMGFIGGGAILKQNSGVTGTATAASLWVTGAIGIAVAYSRYEIAVALSLVAYLTLQFIPFVKDQANGAD